MKKQKHTETATISYSLGLYILYAKKFTNIYKQNVCTHTHTLTHTHSLIRVVLNIEIGAVMPQDMHICVLNIILHSYLQRIHKKHNFKNGRMYVNF